MSADVLNVRRDQAFVGGFAGSTDPIPTMAMGYRIDLSEFVDLMVVWNVHQPRWPATMGSRCDMRQFALFNLANNFACKMTSSNASAFIDNTASKNLNYNCEWLQIAESPSEELTFSQVKKVIAQISSALVKKEFAKIDTALQSANPTKMNADGFTAVARTIFPARQSIPAWHKFVTLGKVEMESRGESPDLLEGLL